jgi:hypothetical protein
MDLSPIGTEITKDGMTFRVTGHGLNHLGQPAEIVTFVGIAAIPARQAKAKQPKMSVKPPVNLSAAVQGPPLRSVFAPPKRPAAKRAQRPAREPSVRPTQQSGPPMLGIALLVVIVIGILALSAVPDRSYKGPSVPTTTHRK